jgi:hypothetical protein
MVATTGQQHFFMVEALSVYVPPHPRSHAIRVGLYELVAASNPSIGEEADMVAVLDTVVERRLCLDAAEEAVALSRLGVDPVAAMVCASLPPPRYRGAARTTCTQSSRKGTGNKANGWCIERPLAAERCCMP